MDRERFALLGNGRRKMRLRFRLPGNLVDELWVSATRLQVFFRFIFRDIRESTSARSLDQRTPMKVRTLEPDADTGPLLVGAQFSDAFCVAIDDAALDARRAAEKMLGYRPRWIKALMALRNYLVTPFGLKTPAPQRKSAANTVGIFPVL